MTLWWAAAVAWAEIPLPSYSVAVADAERAAAFLALDRICPEDRFGHVHVCGDGADALVARIDAWQVAVFPQPGLAYLGALTRRYQGRNSEAMARYRTTLKLDPNSEAAWYDLGELLLLESRLDEAERAFEEVSRLRPGGSNAWLGPWRLAEVAAYRHDPIGLDRHMREALRRGFSFDVVKDLPNWARFYADPPLRDTLRKLLTVYATPELLTEFDRAAP